jgi:polygalacturonase
MAISLASSAALAGGIAPASHAKVCNVRDFGAKGDGKTLDTHAIKAAIDACAELGGTVYFGSGSYVSGTLQLRSHMIVKLGPGSVLSASRDIRDYRPSSSIGLGHTYGTDIAGEGQLTGLLVATGVTDVTVEGPGIIDGQSDAFMSNRIHNPHDYLPASVRSPKAFEAAMNDPAYGPFEPVASGRPGVLLLFFHASDVALDRVNLRNSPNWTLVSEDVDRASVSNFSIVNNPLMPNNDGIDCMACRDVHIHDGTIRTGDDDFAIVNGEDITVSGVSMYSRSAAVRLESTQRAVFNDLTIESNRGLAIFASRQIARPTDGVIFSNIIMRTRLMPGVWWGKAEPIYISVQPCRATCAGGVRNVVFSDIEANAEAGVAIAGARGLEADNVELRNLRLRMTAPDPRLASAVGGNFDRRWTADTPAEGVVKHEVPAVYCEYTRRLTLRDVEIQWGSGIPAYSTAAVDCEHSQALILDDVSESGESRPGPALRSSDTQIDRIEATHLRR